MPSSQRGSQQSGTLGAGSGPYLSGAGTNHHEHLGAATAQ